MADTSFNEDRIGLLIWQISNIWQSKLRKVLKESKLSLNEYLIIETLYNLGSEINVKSQIYIARKSYLDVSVVSTNLNLLENKKIIKRNRIDNRTNNIILTSQGESIIESLFKDIKNEENNLFNKLGTENFNFLNSLKLILGRKIRIKANKK